jgi:primosomal protein N' (replication factor Y)
LSLVAEVAVENALFYFDRLFSYRVPQELQGQVRRGLRVLVPFGRGNRKVQGLVFSVKDEEPVRPLKPVLAAIDREPVLNEEGFRLLDYMADMTFCSYYDALKCILPAGLNVTPEEEFRLIRVPGEEAEALPENEQQMLLYLQSAASQKERDQFFRGGDVVGKRRTAMSLLEKGYLECTDLLRPRIGAKTVRLVRLAEGIDPEGLPSLTAKQREVVRVLAEAGSAAEKEAAYHAGVGESVVRTLVRKGILEYFDREVFRTPRGKASAGFRLEDLELSPGQQEVYKGIRALCQKDEANAALLFGVTGSGKTQVFIKLIQSCLEDGRQAMLLVPEISLTPQLLAKFRGLFGEEIAVIHSSLSMGERLDEYRRIRSGKARISIGTRSSIFAPFENLGLIILDEEGEHSYKSDSTPRYHARDIAKLRCVYHRATLLLASATPSIESYYAAKSGKYTLFTLTERYGTAALPMVQIVDMRKEEQALNFSPLSDTLAEELLQTWQKGEQSILLINRRGFSSFALCMDCGEPVRCPNCSVTLTYHKANGYLMCHYCGYSRRPEEPCPSCGGRHLNMLGTGTQKIEELLAKSIPSARVLRMDTDSVYSRYAYEEKFAAFEAGEYDILVGTQMVAKGLNFPGVTLVGVLGVDQALYANDFRSGERAFSLITQVVGRSGRYEKQGKAVLQTVSPENSVVLHAARQDYEAFYQEEITLRKACLQPPFCDLALVGFSGPAEDAVRQTAEAFHKILREKILALEEPLPIVLLGVSQAGVYRVNNKFRYRILMKCRNTRRFRRLLREAFAAASEQKLLGRITVFVDINGEIL